MPNDKFTKHWELARNGNHPGYGTLKPFLAALEEIVLPLEGNVVDLGCGPTPLSGHLIQKSPDLVRILVDYQDGVINFASQEDNPLICHSRIQDAIKNNRIKNLLADASRKSKSQGIEILIAGAIFNYIPLQETINYFYPLLNKGSYFIVINDTEGVAELYNYKWHAILIEDVLNKCIDIGLEVYYSDANPWSGTYVFQKPESRDLGSRILWLSDPDLFKPKDANLSNRMSRYIHFQLEAGLPIIYSLTHTNKENYEYEIEHYNISFSDEETELKLPVVIGGNRIVIDSSGENWIRFHGPIACDIDRIISQTDSEILIDSRITFAENRNKNYHGVYKVVRIAGTIYAERVPTFNFLKPIQHDKYHPASLS